MNTILYVDDDVNSLHLFTVNLKKNLNVLTAESAEDGLEVLEKNPEICVVVSDMRMPGMNGIEFIKTARLKRPDIKYFILTGSDITGEIIDAKKSGLIQEYFNKPFKVEEIVETVKK